RAAMYIRPWSDSSHSAPSKFTKGCLEDASDRKEFDSTPTLRLPQLSRDTPEHRARTSAPCDRRSPAKRRLRNFPPSRRHRQRKDRSLSPRYGAGSSIGSPESYSNSRNLTDTAIDRPSQGAFYWTSRDLTQPAY